jgi:hypothetical protein
MGFHIDFFKPNDLNLPLKEAEELEDGPGNSTISTEIQWQSQRYVDDRTGDKQESGRKWW